MKFETIEDDILVLKGKWSSNIYFLNFGKRAIIDAGHPKEIEQNIAALRSSGLDVKTVDYLFLTHSHGDHAGSCSYWKEINPNLKICASHRYEEYQNKRKKYSLLKGVEDDFNEFHVDIKLKDGDKLDLLNEQIEIIENPGHTIDSVSFFLPKRRYLFSGDEIYYKLIPQLDYYQDLSVSLSEYKESMKKLSKLNILKIFPGHGDEILKTKSTFELCAKKIKRFESDKELIYINNFIPSVEHYVYKNPGIDKQKITKFFKQNLLLLNEDSYIKNISDDDLNALFEKILSLALILKIIRIEDDLIYLDREINDYIRND
ncbi:MAG TPA: MBL fold metallo-hydrolase [Spirochaetota bacterium]|jgi:glyoxylase-like metal-dependent hydrolase (beta-lactamase superfamily II)|nr:MAG: metallo-beta-lactamase/flavodoxin domain-containing protein [Spirochaetes bacterium ADurb.Bin133]HNZ25688.1 MBL fold metallo-hydrolase [Spirochaetota bacterium]HOF00134.1 MBL fold metallo-hydrolase [Spirochaetota bacterium]HOS32151.1 MBL fold metallo-hydrolase [Spirochaetota bacterium]HOS54573.1 MBL fold metallo-hydrolase [Spirochaetota bacterium]